MKKILIVSHVEEEILEIKNMLGITDVNFISLIDLKSENAINNVLGFTLEKNVELKARKYYELYHLPVITYDIGLEIDRLNNFPGVFTNKIYMENNPIDINNSIISNLNNEENRKASYISYICYYDGNKFINTYEKVLGEIHSNSSINESNFFENIFFPLEFNTCMSELSNEELNSICPFKKAIKKLGMLFNDNNTSNVVQFNHLHFYKVEDFIDSKGANIYRYFDKNKSSNISSSYFKNINTNEILAEDFLGCEYLKELPLTPITDLNPSTGLYNSLQRARISFKEEIEFLWNKEKLLKIKGFGQSRLDELIEKGITINQ